MTSIHYGTALAIGACIALGNATTVCTSVNQSKQKSSLNFTGKLISLANPDKAATIMNIGIGREKSSVKVDQIPVYEKPTNAIAQNNEIKLEQAPETSLTISYLDLSKIKKIEVPSPDIIWTFQPSDKSPIVEFIELRVTERKKKLSFLLELGRKGTSRPTKLFCDAVDTNASPLKQKQAGDDDTPQVCSIIDKKDLREQGVPFQAIKELVIEGYCQKPIEKKE